MASLASHGFRARVSFQFAPWGLLIITGGRDGCCPSAGGAPPQISIRTRSAPLGLANPQKRHNGVTSIERLDLFESFPIASGPPILAKLKTMERSPSNTR